MRLLRTDCDPLQLVEIEGRFIGPYAILSHTWGKDEVVFTDIKKRNDDYVKVRSKAGYRKLSFALAQARFDGYDYLWIDTCCIDKSSSAELSEAINSMFHYYEEAAICYVYLSDVQNQQDLWSSRWFTRGWTLQELLAPDYILFFSGSWELIGDKSSLQPLLTEITKISDRILLKQDMVLSESIARRMSWASHRETTRIEDTAYCLLGIFGINMPLLYGEGENAFVRLQEEITKVTDDQTLFTWRNPDALENQMYGLLAESPRFFSESAFYVPCDDPESEEPYSMTNKRLKVEVRFLDGAEKQAGHELSHRRAVLSCMDTRQTNKQQVSITLKSCSASRNEYRRIHCSALGLDNYTPTLTSIYVPQIQRDYNTRSTGRPSDYIIRLDPEKTFVTSAELFGCTYRTKPDFKKHGIEPYSGTYPKCSGSETPRNFVGEPYSNRMAVALHYIVRIGLSMVRRNVTVLLGMTKDLTLGYQALPDGFDQSLEELENSFSPQTKGPMVVANWEKINSKTKLRINLRMSYRPQDSATLGSHHICLKFGEIVFSS